MTIDSITERLEKPAAILYNLRASVADLKAGLEAVRSIVAAVDEASAAVSDRRARALAALAPRAKIVGQLDPVRPTIATTLSLLAALRTEAQNQTDLLEVAGALAHQLAVRAHEVEQARKPFEADARAAQAYAERVAKAWPSLPTRIASLFRTDVLITRLALSAYSRCPPPRGTHFAYERTFHVPRTIATDAVMRATRLPGVWPVRGNDFAFLEWPDCVFHEDAGITVPLRELNQKNRLSEDEVDHAVARAQSALLVEFSKTIHALREFLRIEAEAPDPAARYPDEGLILDPAMLPKDWLPGLMIKRVVLPSVTDMAVAAE